MGKNKKRQRQEKVHKVEAKESQSCKDSSSDGAPTMTVKSGTKVENVLKFARKTLEEGKHRKIFWTGSGKAITRTISCAETLKRHFQLHQVTEISQKSAQEGAGKVTYIPSIRILQSLDKIDPSTPGYQNPEKGSTFWLNPQTKAEKSSETLSYGHFPKRRKIQEKSEGEVE